MSFFDKKNAIEAASKKRSGGKAAAGMAAAAVAAGGAIIASEAGAATLANVASYTVNDDGSLTVTYADGSTATFAAGSYTISGGQVSIGGGSGAMLAGGAAGLAALAAMALSGGEAAAAADAPAADADADADADDDADDSDDDADSGDDDATAGTFTPSGFTGGDFTGVTATAVSSSTPDVDGTAGNDIFSMADATSAPLVIDGDAGDDKLEITSGATAALNFSNSAADPKVVIDNIEEIEVDPIGTIANPVVTLASSGTTNDDVTLVDIDNASGDVKAAGLDGGDRIEVEGSITSLEVTMAGGTGDTSLIVGVEGVGTSAAGADIFETWIGAPTAAVIETLTIEATVADSFVDIGNNTSGAATGDPSAIKTLNLGGDKALDVDVEDHAAALETIDASNSTGGVNVETKVGASKLKSILGGSGKDNFTVVGTQSNDLSVSGGDGDDVFKIGESFAVGKSLSISGGAGKDDLNMSTLGADATDVAPNTLTLTGGSDSDIFGLGSGYGTEAAVTATITDFEVGASGDVLWLDKDLSQTDKHFGLTSTAAADLDAAGKLVSTAGALEAAKVNIITYASDFDIDNVSGILGEFAADGVSLGAASEAYIVLTDGTDASIWFIANDTTAAITAAEMFQVAEMQGVGDLSLLTADNFADLTSIA